MPQLFERKFAEFCARVGLFSLRVSVGVVFVWFGLLKLFPGGSSAEHLVAEAISVITFGAVAGSISVPIIGGAEVGVGLLVLSGRFMRTTLGLLFVHLLAGLIPFFLYPSQMFSAGLQPSQQGQQVILNLVMTAAAVMMGVSLGGGRLRIDFRPAVKAPTTSGMMGTLPRVASARVRRSLMPIDEL